MKKMIQFCAIIASALFFTACSSKNGTFHNRMNDYRDAKSIPPLVVPKEYATTSMTPYYVIPDEKNASGKPVDLYPPDAQKTPQAQEESKK